MKARAITFRLAISFGLLAALLLVVGWQGFSHLRKINLQLQNVFNEQWREEQLSHEALSLSDANSRITLLVFMLDHPDEIERLQAERVANSERIGEIIRQLEPHAETEQEKQLLETVKATRTPYVESYQKALSLLLNEHKNDEARKMMMEDVRPKLTAYHDAWNAFDQFQANEIAQVMHQGKIDYLASQREFFITLVLAGLMTGAIAIFTVTRMSREIAVRQGAEQSLQQAHEQLKQRIQDRSADLKKANEALRSEITQRKRATEQLDRIFALSPDIIFTARFDGGLDQFNPALEQISGYSKPELLVKSFADFTPPDERAKAKDSLNLIIKNGKNLRFESRCHCKDGSYKWIQWNVVAVPYAQLFNGTGRDVTERKLAEEKLERLRNEHKAVLNSVGVGVHCIDLDGRIKYENPTAAKMLGYEVSDLIGKPAHNTIHHTRADGASYPIGQCHIYATLRDGGTRRVVNEVFWRKNGTSFAVEYTCTPIRDENGHVSGVVVVFSDLTERQCVEARLLQSQKMETVGKLAGGVAHEFNSILTAIIGQSEFLLGELPEEDPLARSAREIRLAADRAATLTRQLLAYGRKQILQPETLTLNRILGDMVSTLQHLVGRDIDVQVVPALGLKKVKIDPGQMEQVIVSIAMNAADAMPNGGKLILETANVILDEDYVRPFPGLKAGNFVMLAISDTGMGMTDEVKARAFEPFFTTKGVGHGIGLGLATCYGIVKQSEGHIVVYSEVGRGTTIKIYLREAAPQTTSSMPRIKSPDMPAGTETILLAEDDPSLLEMSATLLQRLGYKVLTAVNGIEALSMRQQKDIGHIDLLLTDVVMPHMSGKELSDRIRAIYPRTKILFTSAYTENAIIHQGVLSEGVVLLQKPFTPTALANKVREVLDKKSPANEKHTPG